VVAINGSLGTNQIGNVSKMTGLSFDPATSTCYGITSNGGSNPNSLIKFNVGDPNVVGITPLISPFANMNLSDIERNPWNGRYYAVDRANNRLVTVNVNTGLVTYLPNVLGFSPAGLAMDCGGKIYLMRMSGATGNVYVADPNTGGVILGPCAYPGAIIPGPVIGLNTEMGLHFDCDCTFRLVTGNFSGSSYQLTDGLPACLGGPVYTALPNSIKPTVDFSRLN
jgi:DNA-binding beta-propeller fold protein YncE